VPPANDVNGGCVRRLFSANFGTEFGEAVFSAVLILGNCERRWLAGPVRDELIHPTSIAKLMREPGRPPSSTATQSTRDCRPHLP
jgi:hypothetical protein